MRWRQRRLPGRAPGARCGATRELPRPRCIGADVGLAARLGVLLGQGWPDAAVARPADCRRRPGRRWSSPAARFPRRDGAGPAGPGVRPLAERVHGVGGGRPRHSSARTEVLVCRSRPALRRRPTRCGTAALARPYGVRWTALVGADHDRTRGRTVRRPGRGWPACSAACRSGRTTTPGTASRPGPARAGGRADEGRRDHDGPGPAADPQRAAPGPDAIEDDEDDSAMPAELRAWLVRLRLLEGVPFAYLVADSELLPPRVDPVVLPRPALDRRAGAGRAAVGTVNSDDRTQLDAAVRAIRDELDKEERNAAAGPGSERTPAARSTRSAASCCAPAPCPAGPACTSGRSTIDPGPTRPTTGPDPRGRRPAGCGCCGWSGWRRRSCSACSTACRRWCTSRSRGRACSSAFDPGDGRRGRAADIATLRPSRPRRRSTTCPAPGDSTCRSVPPTAPPASSTSRSCRRRRRPSATGTRRGRRPGQRGVRPAAGPVPFRQVFGDPARRSVGTVFLATVSTSSQAGQRHVPVRRARDGRNHGAASVPRAAAKSRPRSTGKFAALARGDVDLRHRKTWDPRLVPATPGSWCRSTSRRTSCPQAAAARPRAGHRRADGDPAPFAAAGDVRPAGVHLHWALPDALLRGAGAGQQEVGCRALPDRWVVVRTLLPVGPRTVHASAGCWTRPPGRSRRCRRTPGPPGPGDAPPDGGAPLEPLDGAARGA